MIRFLSSPASDQATITASSAEIYLPVSNVVTTKPGVMRFAGYYEIDSTHTKLDFQEAAGALVATLTVGTYDQIGLAEHIRTQLNAAGLNKHNVYPLENGRFRIPSDGATFKLLFGTGANSANSCAPVIGFAPEDKTGALTYDSDMVRKHYPGEWIKFNFGAAQFITAAAVVGLQASQAAILRLQANSTDAWTSPSVDIAFPTRDPQANMIYIPPTAVAGYQYVRVLLDDCRSPNPAGMAKVMVGTFWEPTRNPGGWTVGYPGIGSSVAQRENGLDYPTQGRTLRTYTLTWGTDCTLPGDDIEALEGFARTSGMGSPVVLDMRAPAWESVATGSEGSFSGDAGFIVCGFISAVKPKRVAFNRYTVDVDIREMVI